MRPIGSEPERPDELTLFHVVTCTTDAECLEPIPTDAQTGDPVGGTIEFTAPEAGQYILDLSALGTELTSTSLVVVAFEQVPYEIVTVGDTVEEKDLSVEEEAVCAGEDVVFRLAGIVEDPDRIVFFVNGSEPAVRIIDVVVREEFHQPTDRNEIGLSAVAGCAIFHRRKAPAIVAVLSGLSSARSKARDRFRAAAASRIALEAEIDELRKLAEQLLQDQVGILDADVHRLEQSLPALDEGDPEGYAKRNETLQSLKDAYRSARERVARALEETERRIVAIQDRMRAVELQMARFARQVSILDLTMIQIVRLGRTPLDESGLPAEVDSVEFRQHPEGGEIDENPNLGKGKRIFTGKTLDDAGGENKRRKIVAAAQVRPRVSGLAVVFRLCDVDDPTTNVGPIDEEGRSATDNRGDVEASGFVTRSDGSGLASGEFELSLQPGDNFRFGASCHLAHILITTDQRASDLEVPPRATSDLRLSEMVTVWRRAWVEIDSMVAPRHEERFFTGTIDTVHTPDATRPGYRRIEITAGSLRRDGDLAIDLEDLDQFEGGRLEVTTAGGVVRRYPVLGNSLDAFDPNGAIHILVAGLPLPLAGQTFRLFDDDEPSGLLPNYLDLGEFDQVYGPAFIQLGQIPRGAPYQQEVRFKAHANDRHLTDPNFLLLPEQRLPIDYHLAGKGADDFWTFFGTASYQSSIVFDSDPDLSYDANRSGSLDLPAERRTGETAVTGDSDKIGPSKDDFNNVFAAFLETIRDRSMQPTDYSGEDVARLVRYTLHHEIGHLFGLLHWDASIGNAESTSFTQIGIMSSSARFDDEEERKDNMAARNPRVVLDGIFTRASVAKLRSYNRGE